MTTGADSPAAARPLLVELFVEELPPKALKQLGQSFADGIVAGLAKEGLVAAGTTALPFATPRRLAVRVDGVAARADDRAVAHKLMPAGIGLTAAGEATPALLKKLASLGADASAVASLERRSEGKGETLYLDRVAPGASLADGLQRALDATLAALPIPKVMQYQLADGWTTVGFVRPAHGLVALHGSDVVPVGALGLQAGRETLGHRFEAAQTPVRIRDASTYAEQLGAEGAVIAGFAERREEIVRQLGMAAAAAGLVPIDDDALLDEVTALVERPNVLACEFEREFLGVPPECLVLTMKANQKYFPLLDAQGRLTHRFLVVANITPDDSRRVVEGNERVVRPRLADARFFFEQDSKRTLESRVPGLDKVVYHGKLGSQGDRMRRVRTLARWVAERIGADAERAERAATLAKADLLTDMVGEFPELQGIMGGYYAAHDSEPSDVVEAIRTQYQHRRADDGGAAPSAVAEVLLVADRAESLVGLWGTGSKPTGDKDPFALRRAALTLIGAFQRIASPRLVLGELLEEARRTFAAAVADAGASAFEAKAAVLDADVVAEVEAFVYERAFQLLAASYDARAVDAVISLRPALQEAVPRVQAVREFLALPEAPALAAANKRVGNILKKSDDPRARFFDAALFCEPAERTLAAALDDFGGRADKAYDAGDYAQSLRLLAGLKAPVDSFFDAVLVNVDAPALRANRLALLAAMRTTMNRVADLSRLAA